MSDPVRATTLRISERHAQELDLVALVLNITVTEAVRQAVADYIDKNRRDPEFQERLLSHLRGQREVHERLGSGATSPADPGNDDGVGQQF